VSGYAALFNSPSEGLPFTELIAPGAFKRTLSRAKRGEAVVKFLHGHDENRMLATTASGRLTLHEDAQGLRVEAKLDPANPEAAAVISNLTHEAKAMGWSFGFTLPNGSGDKWNGNERTLKEIRLIEVSILSGSTPAYPATIGMAAVRKIAAPRLGVKAEALVDTLEAVRAGKDLTAEQTEMVDTIKSKLGVKPTAIHNSIADAQLRLARMMSEDI
jgi:HK97 family phage prohead protease